MATIIALVIAFSVTLPADGGVLDMFHGYAPGPVDGAQSLGAGMVGEWSGTAEFVDTGVGAYLDLGNGGWASVQIDPLLPHDIVLTVPAGEMVLAPLSVAFDNEQGVAVAATISAMPGVASVRGERFGRDLAVYAGHDVFPSLWCPWDWGDGAWPLTRLTFSGTGAVDLFRASQAPEPTAWPLLLLAVLASRRRRLA